MKTTTTVMRVPVYVPPADGRARNTTDDKWMRLRRAAMKRGERLEKNRHA